MRLNLSLWATESLLFLSWCRDPRLPAPCPVYFLCSVFELSRLSIVHPTLNSVFWVSWEIPDLLSSIQWDLMRAGRALFALPLPVMSTQGPCSAHAYVRGMCLSISLVSDETSSCYFHFSLLASSSGSRTVAASSYGGHHKPLPFPNKVGFSEPQESLIPSPEPAHSPPPPPPLSSLITAQLIHLGSLSAREFSNWDDCIYQLVKGFIYSCPEACAERRFLGQT